mmetsp:Transcript_36142/g.52981  ORF Transcript_36142/g.52981 Transcript_36142/m.52981 type:complete len:278 (+) Transcript_36142:159-992(+)
MQLLDVSVVDLRPSMLLYEVHIVEAAGVSVAVSGVVDCHAAQFDGFFVSHVPSVVGVQHTVGISGAGADRKPRHALVRLQASAVAVDVVQLALVLAVVPPCNHRAARQTVAFVTVEGVVERLRRGPHGNALFVLQLVQPALHAEVALPERAVGGATSHGAQEVGVDLDDFLDTLRRNVGSLRGAGIDGDEDTALEDEAEGRGSLSELDLLAVVLVARAQVVLAVLGGVGDVRQEEPAGQRGEVGARELVVVLHLSHGGDLGRVQECEFRHGVRKPRI